MKPFYHIKNNSPARLQWFAVPLECCTYEQVLSACVCACPCGSVCVFTCISAVRWNVPLCRFLNVEVSSNWEWGLCVGPVPVWRSALSHVHWETHCSSLWRCLASVHSCHPFQHRFLLAAGLPVIQWEASCWQGKLLLCLIIGHKWLGGGWCAFADAEKKMRNKTKLNSNNYKSF